MSRADLDLGMLGAVANLLAAYLLGTPIGWARFNPLTLGQQLRLVLMHAQSPKRLSWRENPLEPMVLDPQIQGLWSTPIDCCRVS